MGGLSGADAICQGLANASPLAQGGIYKAWLSISGESPSTRFTNLDQPGAYELVNGSAIAGDWTELSSGSIERRIDINESGTPISDVPLVLTKTETDGEFWTTASTCDDWQSGDSDVTSGGDSRANNAFWSEGFLNLPCSNDFRLYCFEQK